jgi:hypothetical protein
VAGVGQLSAASGERGGGVSYAKYRNKKVSADGYTFDSLAEYARYNELQILERAGLISKLKVHPAYTLLPGFYDCTGKREQAIKYKADFSYFDHETKRTVVEDVKSRATKAARDWSLRRKLFKHAFPKIELREVAA